MNLFKTLFGVGSMTFLSRILGFLRDSIIARVFGAGLVTDAFFVAFKIPNLLRRISAEGAFTQAFVPILGEYKAKKSKEDVAILINKVTTLLGLFLIGITLLGIFGAPWLIFISAPGFLEDSYKYNLTVNLLQITFPYIFFISLVSLAGGVLNTYGKYIVPAFTPVWLNLSFIIGALFFSQYFDKPVYVLAWAVFFGGLLQLFFQIPFLRQIGFIPKPDLDFKDAGVWRIIKLMGPAVIGVSITQISLLINTIFASFLAIGSVSWLYYADRLMEFPVGVLGVALSTILLPNLSRSFASKNEKEYSKLLNWALKLGLIFAAPAAVGLFILSTPLITTLFYYGAFTAHDVKMTHYAVMAYSVGLVGLIIVKILAPAFYAQQNIKTPVKIALFTLLCTQFMNLLFIGIFQHAGLALAIGLGACVNAFLLFYFLRKNTFFVLDKDWPVFLFKLLISLLVLVIVLLFLKGGNEVWVQYTFLEKLKFLSINIFTGAIIYFLSLWLLGIELKQLIKQTN